MLKFKYNSIYYIDSKINKFEYDSFEDFQISHHVDIQKKRGYYVIEDFLKSVYLFSFNNCLYFSNNLKKIFQFCRIKGPISKDAIEIFLNTGFIPSPFTIYNNLFNICPGYKIYSSYSEINITPDWLTTGKKKFEISKFKNILFDILEDNLRGSKKPCFTLSGGVDSSLLAGMGRKLANKEAYSLTAKMDGFQKELELAKSISRKIGWKNFIYEHSGKEDYEKIVEKFTNETLMPLSDPIIPVIYSMFNFSLQEKTDLIVEGQGADSSCFGLPHNKLMDLHNESSTFIYSLIFKLIPKVSSKSSSFKRRLYRFKKAMYSLSKNTKPEAFISTIMDFHHEIRLTTKIFEYFEKCFKNYPSSHHAVSHIFLYSILPSREMHKYILPQTLGLRFSLPFLNRKLIEYSFATPMNNFFDKGNKKIPIYKLTNEIFPGIFQNNRTSPFYVHYDLKSSYLSKSSELSIKNIKKNNFIDQEMFEKNKYSINLLLKKIESSYR